MNTFDAIIRQISDAARAAVSRRDPEETWIDDVAPLANVAEIADLIRQVG